MYEYMPEHYSFEDICKLFELDEEKVTKELQKVFANGIRRPGSWERGVLQSIFCFEEDLDPGGRLKIQNDKEEGNE